MSLTEEDKLTCSMVSAMEDLEEERNGVRDTERKKKAQQQRIDETVLELASKDVRNQELLLKFKLKKKIRIPSEDFLLNLKSIQKTSPRNQKMSSMKLLISSRKVIKMR